MANRIFDVYLNNQKIEEQKDIIEYLDENNYSDNMIESLSSVSEHRELFDALERENKLKNKNLLISQLEKNKQKRIKSMIIKASVAAVIFVAILSIFLYQPKEDATNEFQISLLLDTLSSPLLIVDNIQLFVFETDLYNFKNDAFPYDEQETTTVVENKIIVPKQQSFRVITEDSTNIILNARSVLKYETPFNRMVELTGEAYFEVTKSESPFIINTQSGMVKVYGTKFNLNSVQPDLIEIALIEGAVGFQAEGMEEILMESNQLLVYNNETKVFTLTDVDASKYIEWTGNKFFFQSLTLEVVLQKIGNWYGVEFDVTEDFSNKKLTLIADRNLPLDEILNHLSNILNINFIKTGDMKYAIE